MPGSSSVVLLEDMQQATFLSVFTIFTTLPMKGSTGRRHMFIYLKEIVKFEKGLEALV